MKPLLFVHLAALLFARCVVGEVQYDTDALDRLSDCSKTCISEAIAASNCTALDDTCLCTDATVLPTAGLCVVESCSVKETLSTQNGTQYYCLQPIRNRTPLFVHTTIAFGTLTGVFILFRFGTKIFILDRDFGMDDLFVLIVFLFGIPSTIMNIHGTAGHGEGQDIWNLEFDKIYKFGFWFYVLEVFYFAQVSLLKMAFLFFYLRIFSGPAQKLLWGTIIFNALYAVVFVFVASFQCTPVSYFWNGWDGEHVGSCLNTTAIGWANASVSVALDIWMLAVPLWCVRNLNMHWKKKLGVAFMFIVGTFVTVVSIVRLQFIIHLGSSHNATYDQLDISIWSTIEINVGIICTCMPSIRLLLVRFFPALKSTIRDTTKKSSNYRDNSRPRSKIPSRDASKVFPENGIELKRTFQVQYTEGDEARLVGAQQMGSRGYTGSRTSVSEGSI